MINFTETQRNYSFEACDLLQKPENYCNHCKWSHAIVDGSKYLTAWNYFWIWIGTFCSCCSISLKIKDKGRMKKKKKKRKACNIVSRYINIALKKLLNIRFWKIISLASVWSRTSCVTTKDFYIFSAIQMDYEFYYAAL